MQVSTPAIDGGRSNSLALSMDSGEQPQVAIPSGRLAETFRPRLTAAVLHASFRAGTISSRCFC